MQQILAIIPGIPGWTEILLALIVGVILFGKRLPDVARSLGKSVVEFKKGVRDIKDDVDTSSTLKNSPRQLNSVTPSPLPSAHTTPEQAPDASVQNTSTTESVNSGE